MSSPSARTVLAGWIALACVLAAAAAVVAQAAAVTRHQAWADEGYYLSYAAAVHDYGWSFFPELTRSWLDDQAAWIFPPPSRVGYIVAAAFWHGFGTENASQNEQLAHLAWLSAAAHLATTAIVFAFVARHRGVLAALACGALIAFSPLYLGLSRLALTDNFVALWQVASLVAFFELVREPQRWLWRVSFVAAFTLAIAAKEMSGLLALAFVAWLVLERFVAKRPLVLWQFALWLALPVAINVAIWTAAAGDFVTLQRLFEVVLRSPATNKYAQMFGSGPWFRYVIDQVLLSPWPALLGIAGFALALVRARRGERDELVLYALCVYATQIAVLSFFTKNVRYVVALDVPLRIAALSFLWQILATLRARWAQPAALAAVALLCVGDVVHFRRLFLHAGIYDPVTSELMSVRGCLPPPTGGARK